MSKKVIVEVKGVSYTLEFNRWAIKRIEALGFSVTNVSEKLVTNIELLFQGSLMKNHLSIKPKQAATIMDDLMEDYDVSDLLDILIDLYMDAMPVIGEQGDNEGKKKLVIVES